MSAARNQKRKSGGHRTAESQLTSRNLENTLRQLNGDNGSKEEEERRCERGKDGCDGAVRAAVVVSRDGDRIREVTVDNRGEVKVEPESERGRMEEKKGLITRKASSDLEEVCDSSQVGFANPFWPLAGYGHAQFP